MKITNKVKFIARIVELTIIILTIILTIMGINYANSWRGYTAYGGEYLIPIFGIFAILIAESIYKNYEEQKKKEGRN